MVRTNLKILLFILSLAVIASGQANSWQGIIPLRSSRDEVEKRFGKPLEDRSWSTAYQTNKGVIQVVYTKQRCEEGWNVAANTVLRITAADIQGKSADELGLVHGRQFLKATDDGGHHSWVDPVKGLQYDFGMGVRDHRIDFILENIVYGPMRSDNDLRCPGFPTYEPERYYFTMDVQSFLDPKLKVREAYHEIVARIDNNAIHVADSNGRYRAYAIVYFDRRRPLKFYKYQLSKLVKEVYGRWKISKEDFVFIEGGIRDESMIEYYIIGRDELPPAPQPTYPSPQFMKTVGSRRG